MICMSCVVLSLFFLLSQKGSPARIKAYTLRARPCIEHHMWSVHMLKGSGWTCELHASHNVCVCVCVWFSCSWRLSALRGQSGSTQRKDKEPLSSVINPLLSFYQSNHDTVGESLHSFIFHASCVVFMVQPKLSASSPSSSKNTTPLIPASTYNPPSTHLSSCCLRRGVHKCVKAASLCACVCVCVLRVCLSVCQGRKNNSSPYSSPPGTNASWVNFAFRGIIFPPTIVLLSDTRNNTHSHTLRLTYKLTHKISLWTQTSTLAFCLP